MQEKKNNLKSPLCSENKNKSNNKGKKNLKSPLCSEIFVGPV